MTQTPLRATVRLLGEHRVFAGLAAAGLLLRLLTTAAYHNAIMFYGDSWEYLIVAQHLRPDVTRPYGYSALLRLLSWTHTLVSVVVVQHLLGIVLGWLVYRFLVGRGLRRGIAALGAAPLLLDGYQIGIEQYLMSETLFETALVCALLLVVRRRLSAGAAAASGLLVAAAMVTRTIGIPVAVFCVVYLLARRVSWSRVAAFALPVVLAYAGYGLWYHHYNGGFALQGSGGRMEYGRVAPFAKCGGLHLSADESVLCNRMRSGTPAAYAWSSLSPYHRVAVRSSDAHAEKVASTFAEKVILHQPLTYARIVTLDTLHFFQPTRQTSGWDFPIHVWRLPIRPLQEAPHTTVTAIDFSGHYARPAVVSRLARLVRDYQGVVFTWGPLLALAVAASIVAVARRRPLLGADDARAGEVAPRLDIALFLSAALMLIVVPNATVLFDYRYLIPAVPLLSVAATLAVARLWPARVLSPAPDAAPVADPSPERDKSWPRPTRVGVGVTVAALLGIALIVAAPIRYDPFLHAYSDNLGRRTALGVPEGAPAMLPGPPQLHYQRFSRATVVQLTAHKFVIIPEAVAVQLTPDAWLRLGPPVKCTQTPTVVCTFRNGVLTG